MVRLFKCVRCKTYYSIRIRVNKHGCCEFCQNDLLVIYHKELEHETHG